MINFNIDTLPQASKHSFTGGKAKTDALKGVQRVKVPVKDGMSQSVSKNIIKICFACTLSCFFLIGMANVNDEKVTFGAEPRLKRLHDARSCQT